MTDHPAPTPDARVQEIREWLEQARIIRDMRGLPDDGVGQEADIAYLLAQLEARPQERDEARRSRDGWEADALNYAKSRGYQGERAERAEAALAEMTQERDFQRTRADTRDEAYIQQGKQLSQAREGVKAVYVRAERAEAALRMLQEQIEQRILRLRNGDKGNCGYGNARVEPADTLYDYDMEYEAALGELQRVLTLLPEAGDGGTPT